MSEDLSQWYTVAEVRTGDLDALVDTICAHPEGHYECDQGDGAGMVNLGFRSTNPTLVGVKVEARAAVVGALRELDVKASDVTVLSLTRGADMTVFDADDI